MGDIDAHQHFWRYDAAAFGWIERGGVLARDFLPDDLPTAMGAAGVSATIAVQARAVRAETDWLLALAARTPWIAGVVGWLDLTDAAIADVLAEYRDAPRLVGLRHLVQDEADDAFLRRADFVHGVKAAVAQGLAYDILVFARQAVYVPAFLDAVGDGRFVLDHGGKPPIAAGGWQPWADAVARIAEHPGVWCKLSGLVTEAGADWQPDDLARYMDHLLACFGAERLIFGSDWPVCTLATPYARVHALAADFVARACPGARDAVFGGNARAAYRLADAG